jgi:hypothetical protein
VPKFGDVAVACFSAHPFHVASLTTLLLDAAKIISLCFHVGAFLKCNCLGEGASKVLAHVLFFCLARCFAFLVSGMLVVSGILERARERVADQGNFVQEALDPFDTCPDLLFPADQRCPKLNRVTEKLEWWRPRNASHA